MCGPVQRPLHTLSVLHLNSQSASFGPTSVAAIGQTDQANHQYGMTDFWNAVNNGNIPAVSFLKAPRQPDRASRHINPTGGTGISGQHP